MTITPYTVSMLYHGESNIAYREVIHFGLKILQFGYVCIVRKCLTATRVMKLVYSSLQMFSPLPY